MSPTIDRSSRESSSPAYMMPVAQKKLIQEDKPHLGKGGERESFQRLLDDIRREFSRPDKIVDVDSLWRVLEDYQSDELDWSKFAHFDSTKYKRNFVEGGDEYDVMIIAWGPGTQSCIHDHPGSHCFMKVLQGELIESRFAWPVGAGRMRKIVDTHAKVNEIIYINGEFPSSCFVFQPSLKRKTGAINILTQLLTFHHEQLKIASRFTRYRTLVQLKTR